MSRRKRFGGIRMNFSEIVPAYALHKEMSSGVSYGEQLIEDIERLKRHFPAVPIKVILIDT